jgi:hypothetical protein
MSMTTASPPTASPHANDDAKGTPPPRPGRKAPTLDGGEARERGHRAHRRRCRHHLRLAQHAILARLIEVDEAWAPDFEHLPAASSGSRTFVGTAFGDLSRSRLIRTVGPPVTTTIGGRHAHYLHRWALAVDASVALAWMQANPVPDPVEDGDDQADGDLATSNKDARRDGHPDRASGCDATITTNQHEDTTDAV